MNHQDSAIGAAALDASDAAKRIAFLGALGERVRQTRSLRGMSRKTLSELAGISERYIAQLEAGKGNFSIVLLRRICLATGVAIGRLFDDPKASEQATLCDMLRAASPEQLAAVRHALTGEGLAQQGRVMERIALIGLRGAGKSTLGRIVAERLGWPFVELNREIERFQGLSIVEIFAIYGQEGFRRMEQAALRQIIARPGPLIVATGGGIVADAMTYELLVAAFFTIWIKAKPEEHMARVRAQGDLRPMADDKAAMSELRNILASRAQIYARANAIVDTADTTELASADHLATVIAAARARPRH